jgi:hypothetical protein
LRNTAGCEPTNPPFEKHPLWDPQNLRWHKVVHRKLFLCSLKSFSLHKIRTDPQTKATDKDYDTGPNLLSGNKKYIKELRRNSFHRRSRNEYISNWPTFVTLKMYLMDRNQCVSSPLC